MDFVSCFRASSLALSDEKTIFLTAMIEFLTRQNQLYLKQD